MKKNKIVLLLLAPFIVLEIIGVKGSASATSKDKNEAFKLSSKRQIALKNEGIEIGDYGSYEDVPGHTNFLNDTIIQEGPIDPFIIARLSSVPQKYLQLQPGTNAPILSAVGAGIDVTRCGLYAYESEEIHFDIFDRAWLNSYYQNGFYKASHNAATIDYAMTNSIESLETSLKLDSSSEAFGEASYSFYKASVAGKVGFSTSNKLHSKETSLIYNLKSSTYAFDYELPKLSTNRSVYLEHLDTEYLDELTEACSNSYVGAEAFYGIFQKYGTHVLWKAGFGGACDILYSAHSKEFSIDSSVKNEISASLSASCSDAKAGVQTNFSMAASVGVAQSSIEEKIRGQFVGGKPGAAGVGLTFKEIADRANIWSQNIEDYPAVLSYTIIYPIWDILPNSLKNYKSTISEAYSQYKEFNRNYYESQSKSPICANDVLNDTKVELREDQKIRCADYWDRRADKTFTFDFTTEDYYNARKLKQLGFTKVTIHPTFTLKEARSGTKVTVKGFFDDGNGEQSHSTYPIDVSDKKEHSYTGQECDWSISIDKFISKPSYKLIFSTNNKAPAFFHWTERAADIYNLILHVNYSKD